MILLKTIHTINHKSRKNKYGRSFTFIFHPINCRLVLEVSPTLVYCWADVVDGGLTVNERILSNNILELLKNKLVPSKINLDFDKNNLLHIALQFQYNRNPSKHETLTQDWFNVG